MWAPAERVRPTSVIALTVLAIIMGVFALLAGAAMFLAAHILATVPQAHRYLPLFVSTTQMIILGGFYVGIACVYFFVAYGYWSGRGWAWILGIALAMLGIIFGILSLPIGLLDVVVNAVIIYLLMRRDVREYLGRAPPAYPPTPPL